LGGRVRWISEFEAGLVYKVSSRTARAIQRNPVSKKKKKRLISSNFSLSLNHLFQIESLMEVKECQQHEALPGSVRTKLPMEV
jgi:hypothetical protein